jgi:hypothetical protein
MSRVAFALLFCWMAPALLPAQPLGEAAGPLAARISSLLQRRTTVFLEFQNLTPLAPAEWSSFRGALEDELRKAGVETAATAQPETRLRVTISENARGLLLVAETMNGESRQVAMLPWNAPPRAEAKARIKMTMQPIWEQAEPVLDLLLLDSGGALLVLAPGKVSSYRLANGKWTLAGVAAVSLTRPPARDPRGRLETGPSGLRVYLPGITCSGAPEPEVKLTCSAGNEGWRDSGWQVRWQTNGNLLESDSVRGAFYSVASGIIAAAEGRIQDRSGEPVAGADAWGSDLATIGSACGVEPVVVAAKAGDGPRDEVQAYEVTNGLARAVSEAVGLPGPVTALWPAETPGQLTVVIRNSKTGNYEASRLGLACAE